MTRPSRDPEDCCAHFAVRYDRVDLPPMLALERAVLGCEYGGTSWTTREQAELMAERLALEGGLRLLDIGSGAGWPALYFAHRTACRLTLVDLEIKALAKAGVRARRDDTAASLRTLAAGAAALPLASDSHEAVSHSDVLCCLPDKVETLGECRRVAVRGAAMVFSVISLTPGLSGAAMSRAVDAGPPYVESPGDYAALLRDTGWSLVERWDVTDQYAESLRLMIEGLETIDGVREAMGEEDWLETLGRRRGQVEALGEGLLAREIFSARAA